MTETARPHHADERGGRVLVVDAANVIGSVPDGWWRDRAGAAARLHAAVAARPPAYEAVVIVLEGAARAGVPEGTQGALTTIHARGEGDDTIAAWCRDLAAEGAVVSLASADRGLIARVAPYGVAVVGPRSIPRS